MVWHISHRPPHTPLLSRRKRKPNIEVNPQAKYALRDNCRVMGKEEIWRREEIRKRLRTYKTRGQLMCQRGFGCTAGLASTVNPQTTHPHCARLRKTKRKWKK
jgi:hypothetical protein